MSAYGPFELAPLEAVPVPAATDVEAVRAAAFEEGFAAAVAEAQGSLEGPAGALATAASELRALRAQVATSVEADAVDLALQIAEQALGAALAVDRALVVEVIRGALRCLVERDRVLILVNPDDAEVVREQVGDIAHCEVQAERRVRPGGAIVRIAEGEVDATLQTKLARAREVLERELAHG